MSVNSTLTGNYRNPDTSLRCETMSVDGRFTTNELEINGAIKQRITDPVALPFPTLTHTFDANLTDVFIVDFSTFPTSSQFVDGTTYPLTIVVNNLSPNAYIKASLISVETASSDLAEYKIGISINTNVYGTYVVYITNNTGEANLPLRCIMRVMLEQVVAI